MATCCKCNHFFKTLEDESDDHPCPKCGYHPECEEEEDEARK